LDILDEVKKPEFAGGVASQDGTCGGQWRYPRNCLPENGTCEYAIQWTYKGKKVIYLIFLWRSLSCKRRQSHFFDETDIMETFLRRIW